jgi:glycosyltransferase involved in cell wall biosynthesis
MKNKNLLVISTPAVNYAAGVVYYDLHKGLSQYYNSQILVRYTDVKEQGVISYLTDFDLLKIRLRSKLNKLLGKKKKKLFANPDYYFFELNLKKNMINIKKARKKINPPDIIVASLMQFYSLKDVYDLQKTNKSKVFLNMADMVFITGGCHYCWDCKGYMDNCTDCPAILKNEQKYFAADNLKFHQSLIEEMDVEIVANSQEHYQAARHSSLFKNKKVHFVLAGIDTSVFYYSNQLEFLRDKYQIDKDAFIVLFGATYLDEMRKGVKYFIEAMKLLEKEIPDGNIMILGFGSGNLQEILPDIRFKVQSLGYIQGYEKVAEVFNLADVFISTTLQDSGPITVNQSIACGTPVVGFGIGVAETIVVDGITGYRCEARNSLQIAQSINKIYKLSPDERLLLRKSCSDFAKENFSKEVMAENYFRIINQ